MWVVGCGVVKGEVVGMGDGGGGKGGVGRVG